jgi:DNA-binding MarR family transcriptional regulator
VQNYQRNNSLLLLRLNPSTIDQRQQALFAEELKPLPSQKIDDIELEDHLYRMLNFVQEQNQRNLLLSFKRLGQHFDITKVTTAKRVTTLEEKGLIFVKKLGRSKTLHITEKGKKLLAKRAMV